MSEVMFFTSVWILYSNPAALKKWLVTLKNDLYTTEILLVNFQLFYTVTIFLVFLKLEILNCRSVTLEKKGEFCKFFVCLFVFKILEHPFHSEYFQKSICSGVFSPVVDGRLFTFHEGELLLWTATVKVLSFS